MRIVGAVDSGVVGGVRMKPVGKRSRRNEYGHATNRSPTLIAWSLAESSMNV